MSDSCNADVDVELNSVAKMVSSRCRLPNGGADKSQWSAQAIAVYGH